MPATPSSCRGSKAIPLDEMLQAFVEDPIGLLVSLAYTVLAESNKFSLEQFGYRSRDPVLLNENVWLQNSQLLKWPAWPAGFSLNRFLGDLRESSPQGVGRR